MNANTPAVYVWDVQTNEFLLLLLIVMLNIAVLNATAYQDFLETKRLQATNHNQLKKSIKNLKSQNP